MANLNPTQAAENWSRGLGAATEAMRQGVMAVQVSPTAKAADRADAYAAGVAQAVADGRYQAGLRRVSLGDWQKAFVDKALPIIASRAATSKPNYAAFANKFFPHLQAGMSALDSTPRGTIDQNIARAVAMMRHNAQFKMT